MGGAQAVAAMALGLFSKRPAEIIAGPGNRFVAEAKRALFGRVGIDLFAGPTEILIIADKAADANIIAADLAAQAEHGADSPCWLIVTDRALGEKVAALMPGLIKDLPPRSQEAATAAWRDCGEIVFCENIAAAAEVANEYAAEHLEIHTAANDELIPRLKNYGALFIGEEASVAHGDKCSGPNHILPTRAAARYTGGLGVHKFLKVVTTQKMSREASVRVGEIASRLSRREGMEAHARSIDERVAKYKGE
jgi:sulfopropanediol 3-dehydrogenase